MELPNENHIEGAIAFPGLQKILEGCHADLAQMAHAVEQVSMVAFGAHTTLLPARERLCRRNLFRFANLLRQLSLLHDIPVYTVGHRCPEQLRVYDRCLREGIATAHTRGIENALLEVAEEAHHRLWQVEQVVTLFYDGLS